MSYYFAVLNKYGDFSGRARRSEYWFFFLFNIIFSYIFLYIEQETEIPALRLLYILAIIIPFIAVTVRRMHDINKSGWYALIPVYNLILACTDGSHGPNEYGDDPKRPDFIFEMEEIGNNLD